MNTTEPVRRSPSLPWLVLAVLSLCMMAAGVGWWLGSLAPETSPGLSDPAEWTRFRLLSLDGRHIGPPDFEGQIVLVDFWATWCAPCHVQAKILDPLYEEFRGKGVEFLAVSLGEAEETVRAFVEESPFPYPVLVDPQDWLAAEAGIYALPTVLVIDRQGSIAYLQEGISNRKTLRQVLLKAGAS